MDKKLQAVIAIISDFVDVDPAEVTVDSKLRSDLGLNSFDFVNIAVEVEREYNIKIPDTDISQLKTVGDLLALVDQMQTA
ncbi:MAG: acyl carrier protein [Clostridia bacterium]|jgi:acyl carrier protein|nr:acyl carrier protein [Clostridia bacterium]